jgi:hypothetical protein
MKPVGGSLKTSIPTPRMCAVQCNMRQKRQWPILNWLSHSDWVVKYGFSGGIKHGGGTFGGGNRIGVSLPNGEQAETCNRIGVSLPNGEQAETCN